MEPTDIPLEWLKKQALQDAISHVYKKYYKDDIEINPLEYLRLDEDDDVIQWLKSKPTGLGYSHTFITVTPKSTVTFKELNNKVKKALKKKWIKSAHYCYEWRNGDEGLHLHMLVEFVKTKKPSHVHREFWSTFKNLLGECKKNVTVINTNKPANIMQYLKGYKDGQPKRNAGHDIINRTKLNILNPKQPISYHLERSGKPLLP